MLHVLFEVHVIVNTSQISHNSRTLQIPSGTLEHHSSSQVPWVTAKKQQQLWIQVTTGKVGLSVSQHKQSMDLSIHSK